MAVMTTVDLNQSEELKKRDLGGMMQALLNLPDQCREALRLAKTTPLPTLKSVAQVVVTGLGGSAIGGDFLRIYLGEKAPFPVIVNRDYTLPAFVGKDSLVFAVSYSGDTEETLEAYDQARKRGATIIAVTTGGKLAKRANADGVPLITIPGGISPRAATGYLFIPTAVALSRMGLIPPVDGEVEELIGVLEQMRGELGPDSPVEENQAKQMAQRFFRKIPVIYASSTTTEVAAIRWKGQINENAKAIAYYNIFPELNHNELVGFEEPGELVSKIEMVYLRDKADHPRVQKRMEITHEIVGKRISGKTEIHSRGEGHLARLYSLTYAGDFTSVYLAFLYGIDPSPVKVISFLKESLAAIH